MEDIDTDYTMADHQDRPGRHETTMSLLHHDDPKIARLRTVSLFANASTTALRHLASAADEISVRDGTDLIVQGHQHAEAYVITSGKVSVSVDGEVVAEIPDGQIVGELALFGHGPASATVTAAGGVTALSIPNNRFDQIMDDNPNLTKAIAKQLAGRLHDMDERHRSADQP